jgi:prophage antirepressor-like protein
VIGCEYGHLRLIDLCRAIGMREKGQVLKKIKKRRQRKVFGEIPPSL